MANSINNFDDVIDSREVIDRIEELEEELEAAYDEAVEEDGEERDWEAWVAEQLKDPNFNLISEWEELVSLRELAEEADGCADWEHGETLIRESYFETYAEELASDIGAINRDATWPNNCIDWARAARELQQDYTEISYGGVSYFIRS